MVENDEKVFGFWIYLMTDLIIFAVLFATFIVLRTSTFDGPSGRELFHLPSILIETLILLVSSFTCALAMMAIQQKQKSIAILWFIATFSLGSAFLFLEISDFSKFVEQGASWKRSAFLSSFFTLVGTHGFHISIGLLWIIVVILRILLRPLIDSSISRIFRMTLFWHFLDIVWIFIFTIVYGVEFL